MERNLLLTLPQKKDEKKQKRSVDYFEERGIGQLKDDGGRHSVGYLEERGIGQAKDDGAGGRRSLGYLEERGIGQSKDDGAEGRHSLGYLEERGVGQVKDDGDSKDDEEDDDDDGLKVSDLKWIMVWCNQVGVDLGHVILDNGGKTLFGDDNIENDIFS